VVMAVDSMLRRGKSNSTHKAEPGRICLTDG
jgi:hypothetical protein